ncbi:MAG: hypothetical protein J7L61_01710, partial [Thermoplasmata archaeon]|nr:hypothetical protein [Thermoplasmata archaeon]
MKRTQPVRLHGVISLAALCDIASLVLISFISPMSYPSVGTPEISERPEGVRVAQITITIEPYEIDLHLSEGETGNATFNGTITCTTTTRCVVSLKATASLGNATVQPSGIVFPVGTHTENFTVTATESYLDWNLTDTVVVSGKWQSGATAGSVQETTLYVNVIYNGTAAGNTTGGSEGEGNVTSSGGHGNILPIFIVLLIAVSTVAVFIQFRHRIRNKIRKSGTGDAEGGGDG